MKNMKICLNVLWAAAGATLSLLAKSDAAILRKHNPRNWNFELKKWRKRLC